AGGAGGVADNGRASVEQRGRGLGYPEGLVTVSIGVAEFVPGRGPESEDVLVAADRALYRAKAAGRDQVATGETLKRDRSMRLKHPRAPQRSASRFRSNHP